MNEDLFAIRQKNANWALWMSLLSLGLFTLSTWLSCALLSRWDAVIGAVLLLIPGIILQWRAKQRKHLGFFSLALNSLANGLVVSFYYLHYSIPVSLKTLLASLLLPVCLLLCTYIFLGLLPGRGSWSTLLLM